MRILFDHVDWNSTAGPHWFARKLADYLYQNGHAINQQDPDVQLSFVIATQIVENLPLIQRLDGIWYNTEVDYVKMNEPIKQTYDVADGVIFQSEWAKEQHQKFGFNLNKPYGIIPNSADENIFNTKYEKDKSK